MSNNSCVIFFQPFGNNEPVVDTDMPFHFVAANEVHMLVKLMEPKLADIKKTILQRQIFGNVVNMNANDILLAWKKTNRGWKEFWEILRNENLTKEMELLETACNKEKLVFNFDLLHKHKMLDVFVQVYDKFLLKDKRVVTTVTVVRIDTSDQLIQLLCSVGGQCINQFYQEVAESNSSPDSGSNILENIALVPDRYSVSIPRSVSC